MNDGLIIIEPKNAHNVTASHKFPTFVNRTRFPAKKAWKRLFNQNHFNKIQICNFFPENQPTKFNFLLLISRTLAERSTKISTEMRSFVLFAFVFFIHGSKTCNEQIIHVNQKHWNIFMCIKQIDRVIHCCLIFDLLVAAKHIMFEQQPPNNHRCVFLRWFGIKKINVPYIIITYHVQ